MTRAIRQMASARADDLNLSIADGLSRASRRSYFSLRLSLMLTVMAVVLGALVSSCTTVREFASERRIDRQVRALLEELENAQGDYQRTNNARRKVRELEQTAVPSLVRSLNSKSWMRRVYALRVLGRMGPKAETALPAVMAALQDEQFWVRTQAVYTLGDMACEPDLVIPALLPFLRDPEEKMRFQVRDALKKFGAEAQLAVPPLLEALHDENPEMRQVAASALGAIGAHFPEAIAPLEDLLHDADERVRAAAATALGNIGPTAYTAAPAMIRLTQEKEATVRSCAVGALGGIFSYYSNGQPALPAEAKQTAVAALIKAMHYDDDVRKRAAHALCNIGPGAVAGLVESLTHDDFEVRRRAARALGGMSRPPKAAVPALVRALADEEQLVSWEAALVLPLIENDVKEVVPILMEILEHKDDPDERFHQRAVRALGEVRPEGVDGLLYALFDPNKDVRIAAVRGLHHAEKAIPALIHTLKYEDIQVRREAVKTLRDTGMHGPQRATLREKLREAVPALAKVLQEDVELRQQAAEALKAFTAVEGAIPTLIELLKADDPEVRQLAACSIGSRESKETVFPALVQALSDKERCVRWSAAVSLVLIDLAKVDEALPVLTEAVKDQSRTARRMPEGVLEALGYFGPEAVPALRIALDNKWPRVRADAVYALGQGQKGPAAVTLIMHALDDRDARVRLAALKALGWTVQDPDVLTSIYQKALKDPNENVRAAVAEALRRGSNP